MDLPMQMESLKKWYHPIQIKSFKTNEWIDLIEMESSNVNLKKLSNPKQMQKSNIQNKIPRGVVPS